MAPLSTFALDENSRYKAGPHASRSMKSRWDCEASRPDRATQPSEIWRNRLRSRPTPTTIEVFSSLSNKRKYAGDECVPRTQKRKKTTLQQPDIQRQIVKRGLYEDVKPKKRKREQSLHENLAGNGGSISHLKRQKSTGSRPSLTRLNLKHLQQTMSPSASTKSRGRSGTTSSKRLFDSTQPSSESSRSSRAYSAKDVGFENALKDSNVDLTGREELREEEVERILEIMERKRDSPVPDQEVFHNTRLMVSCETEPAVTTRLTPLLLPPRDLPHNNHNTKNLLYRQDTLWQNWGSAQPGILPTPKPDLCISFTASAFTLDEREQICSPYADKAGFAPGLTCEVKTALQGSKIADRQNANNMILTLEADFELQQRLGQDQVMERTIRSITTAHDTRNQWYEGWFYILENGKPKWCSQRLKSVNLELRKENGFEIARQYNLNLCEHLSSEVLPQLLKNLAEDSIRGSSHIGGVMTQPHITLEPGLSTPADSLPHNEEDTPSVNGHKSSAELPATSKRTKVSLYPVTRSISRGGCVASTQE